MKKYWTQIILFYLTMFSAGFLIVRFYYKNSQVAEWLNAEHT